MNTVAVVVPIASWLADVQPILAAILTMLGIGWYVVLFAKEWRKRE